MDEELPRWLLALLPVWRPIGQGRMFALLMQWVLRGWELVKLGGMERKERDKIGVRLSLV